MGKFATDTDDVRDTDSLPEASSVESTDMLRLLQNGILKHVHGSLVGNAFVNAGALTVATLDAEGPIGLLAWVTDGDAGLALGDTVTGGGEGDATPYLVWFNGTNWTVIGK